MTGDVLLDTTVAVAHLRGVATVSQRLAAAQALYLPAVALGELYYGIQRSARAEENLHQLTRWLRATVLVPVSAATAERYGSLLQISACD